jgi:hypothetical protein
MLAWRSATRVTAEQLRMKPTRPTRSTIPCYAADGTSLGFRTLDAAQHLVAGGYVRPSYGRKGHLKAIWLLRDDGTSPVRADAHHGTRYSYIESLATGRCWQHRRLGRDTATEDGLFVTARDPFIQVIRECMSSPPEAQVSDVLTTDSLATATLTPATHARLQATAAHATRNRQVTPIRPGVTDAPRYNL